MKLENDPRPFGDYRVHYTVDDGEKIHKNRTLGPYPDEFLA